MNIKLFDTSHGINADILYHDIWNVPGNALFITLPEPQELLSSREGLKKVTTICNCYLPKPIWHYFDEDPKNWDKYLGELVHLYDNQITGVAVLSTGVTMDFLAVGEEVFRDTWVKVFVTAGVHTNAMRIGVDKASTYEYDGSFETIGTINTIVFTSAGLDLSGMAASFITITEAKNIALQDMGVKSVFTPELQATGTGTDQIIIVPGHESFNSYVGGHTKLGEMLARTVTATTIKALQIYQPWQ